MTLWFNLAYKYLYFWFILLFTKCGFAPYAISSWRLLPGWGGTMSPQQVWQIQDRSTVEACFSFTHPEVKLNS